MGARLSFGAIFLAGAFLFRGVLGFDFPLLLGGAFPTALVLVVTGLGCSMLEEGVMFDLGKGKGSSRLGGNI